MRRAIAFLVSSLLASALPAAAQRLPGDVHPERYDLAFTVDLPNAAFEGDETVRVRLGAPASRIVLNALDITFHEVTIGDGGAAQKATVVLDKDAQTATLTVSRPIPAGVTAVHIRYAGVLNDQLRGFYLSKGRDRNYAVTQFESTDARRAFPCFDEPSYKAVFSVTLTVDRRDTAISNGRVVSDTPGPSASQHTVRFADSPKMSSYLVAMAVGDFQCTSGASDGIPIRVCATPDKKDLTRIALESAEQILHFYDGYFTVKYPFVKLDVLAVPDFAAGAMENTAAIFYRETDLLADAKSASVSTRKNIASVLAHEMAHQWFGDLVTMAWWDDIWLNEGFATWMANKPLAALHPDWHVDVDEAKENRTALGLDSLKSTRAIHAEADTPAQIDEAFDAIAYEKGASVLRMVENYVGADAFRKGINSYLQAHEYANATSEDFAKSIAASSGKPVERMLPTFVNQPGVPVVSVSLSCPMPASTMATMTAHRFLIDGSASSDERWQIPVCYAFAGTKHSPNRQPFQCAVMSDKVEVGTTVGSLTSNSDACQPWVFANLDARGYYRTEYAPELLRKMSPDVETKLTAPERLSLVDDEWALVKTGRHSIGDYLSLIAGFGRENTSGVLSDVTNRLQSIHEDLTTAETRPKLEAFVRSLLRPLYDELGMTPAASDDDNRRALRAVVVDALGSVGADADVARTARAMLDRALNGGSALDPTLADAVVTVSAAHGDAKLFDAMLNAADKATSPEERYRYLYAIADFTDPALVDRGLQLVLTDRIRTQDAAIYLAQFLANPSSRDRAWTFLTTRWTELAPKVTIFGGDVNIVHATGAFCDAGAQKNVSAFFAAHPLPAAQRALSQAEEQIAGCVRLRERQAPQLAEWLNRR
ncbi:MAG TPA: M1 family metallopeptidase [Vicinamibacterales bacterium]|nr:M1 family metallopeptidase [Vicinamibacterales bacterium]